MDELLWLENQKGQETTSNLQSAEVAWHDNPGVKEMEALVVAAQHRPQDAKHGNRRGCLLQHIEVVAAHQAMPLGGTDGNSDRCQNNSREALLLAQNLD